MALRLLLGVIGLGIIYLGLNIALGGITTLGWRVDPSFVEAIDAEIFAVQDNHTRFLGGVWLTIGLLFAAGAIWLHRFGQTLFWLCCLIAFSGLFRLSAPDLNVITDPRIIRSFALEMILFPLLAYWLHKVNQQTTE